MKIHKMMMIVLVLALLGGLISACGGGESPEEQAYRTTANQLLNTFADKHGAFTSIISGGPQFGDAAWEANLNTTLDELDQAAYDLGNIQNVPAKFADYDGLLQQLSATASTLTQAMRDAQAANQAGNTDEYNAKLVEMQNAEAQIVQLSAQIVQATVK